MKNQEQHTRNVWYYYVVKPLIRKRRVASYKASFVSRTPPPIGGIPVSEVAGLTEIFDDNYRQYAPLIGVACSYNNVVENLYRFGSASDPAVQLVRNLFVQLPGGDICPTHAGHRSGAHLLPSLIGAIFVSWETMQQDPQPDILVKLLLQVVTEDPGYQDEREQLRKAVADAQETLQDLRERRGREKELRKEIKRIEGDVIKRNCHKKKRFKKKTNGENSQTIDKKIERLDAETAEGEKEVSHLRSLIVSKLEVKAAEKALHRAEKAIEMERKNLFELMDILARSFCKYDVDSEEPRYLFKYATTAILLAFMWRKYDSVRSLRGYFESMARLGALRCPIECVLDQVEPRNGFDCERFCLDCPDSEWHRLDCRPSRRFQSWRDIERAVIFTLGKPGLVGRAPVVPFSFVSWAAYSEHPDCGETALRNLINELVYTKNGSRQRFDHELLVELREKYYPELQSKLIDFYKTHWNPQEAMDHDAGRDWLEVTYDLNQGREETDELVRYRRPREQKNIASPLSNLLRVFNALFGIEPLDWQGGVEQVAKHINDLRGSTLEVDISQISQDGFGILKLTDGEAKYELQSFKPVHFGFIQTENSEAGRVGREAFRLFRKLMRYSCGSARAKPNELDYFEQLMLASLFVPYQLERHKLKALFRECPCHYPLLFADLNSSRTINEAVLTNCMTKNGQCPWQCPNNEYLAQLVDSISNYKEPSFLPHSAAKEEDTEVEDW